MLFHPSARVVQSLHLPSPTGSSHGPIFVPSKVSDVDAPLFFASTLKISPKSFTYKKTRCLHLHQQRSSMVARHSFLSVFFVPSAHESCHKADGNATQKTTPRFSVICARTSASQENFNSKTLSPYLPTIFANLL